MLNKVGADGKIAGDHCLSTQNSICVIFATYYDNNRKNFFDNFRVISDLYTTHLTLTINKNLNINKKLNEIYESLNKYSYYDNNYLLILMLMRILPYSKNIKDEKFLCNNINYLWNNI